MNRRFTAFSTAVLTSAVLLAACSGGGGSDATATATTATSAEADVALKDSDDEGISGATPKSLTLSFLSRVEGRALGASEISAFDPDSRRLFVTNAAAGRIDIIDLSKPAAPVVVGVLDLSDIGRTPNSVDVAKGIVAVAVEAATKTDPGKVAFFRAADGERLAVVTVGAQPDMLVFTPDGEYVVVANEGEPNSYGAADSVDPEGSISIIEVERKGRSLKTEVRTAGFSAWNGRLAELRAKGVRIFGPNATVAQDLEPEYVTIAPDGKTAYVTLQENNAVATVDLESAKVTAIRALGLKDHALAGQGLDPSDEDTGIDSNSGSPVTKVGNWPVSGMYMPDGIASYRFKGQTYLVTANEGDDRSDWPGIVDRIRVRDHCGVLGLDPAIFGTNGLTTLTKDSNLGRLRITALVNGGDTGKNAAGQCTKLVAYGARSFSIWRAADLTRVYDSGEDLERRTTALPNAKFNADNEGDALDSRSPNKGPEPEGVVLGRFGSKTYAFVGLERIGGVMVYDITDPTKPAFETYLNTRQETALPLTAAGAPGGDRGPEGLKLIPAKDSPNRKPLLVVSNETSGTTAILQIDLGR